MELNVVIALLTCFGTGCMVLFHGGRQVGRVEAAVSRLSGIEKSLEKIGELVTRVGVLEGAYERLRSDHKDLRHKVDDTTKDTATMRGRYESHHDD
jgi:hypothetical protein